MIGCGGTDDGTAAGVEGSGGWRGGNGLVGSREASSGREAGAGEGVNIEGDEVSGALLAALEGAG